MMATKDDKKGLRSILQHTVNKVKEEKEEKVLDQEIKDDEDIEESSKMNITTPNRLIELIHREAFWERMTIKQVHTKILEEYFKDKKLDPIPDHLRPTKRGKKKKSRKL
jgi:hypothetical protein